MKQLFIITILLSIALYSCEKKTQQNKAIKQKAANSKKDIVKTKINDKTLTTLFRILNDDKTEEIRISAYQSSEYDKYLLVADTNFIIISKYLKSNEKFILSKKDTLLSNEYISTHIDSASLGKKNIGGKEYLSLALKEEYQGTAITGKNVTFYMVAIENFKVYTLFCSGSGSVRASKCEDCVDGELISNKELDAKPEIKKSLYELANKSKLIYHPSKKELDISYYKNYDSKWYIDNNTTNDMANGYSGVNDTIYSMHYKENLFDFTGDRNNQDIIENKFYKVVTFFRGNVLGYDKRKHVYFPIQVESCFTGCNKVITFISDTEIKVMYDEDSEKEYFIIDLKKINFVN
ncbi:hypothetical protein [Flavobacterium algicola]|uniref:hypothetical protein n=1 Tax=Flavobacterium algicola TaxID=556529 RepID=UPI001EFE8E09|nr:hypothetical protein [Flavobacterium algicola]MCG9791255.1 hypothetical protein [Flavobacterium algicola]